MSPRAAWRLESLGFTDVYEYSAGKSDWGAVGLPLEGKAAKSVHVKDIVRGDVPTCGLADTVGSARLSAKDWDTCIVVNGERVVFGRLFKEQLEGDPNARVGDVMRAQVRAPSGRTSARRRCWTTWIADTTRPRL